MKSAINLAFPDAATETFDKGWPALAESSYRPSTKDQKSRFFPTTGGFPPTPDPELFAFQYPLPMDDGTEFTSVRTDTDCSRSCTPTSFSGSEDFGDLEDGYGDDVDGLAFGVAELWVNKLTREDSDEEPATKNPVCTNDQ